MKNSRQIPLGILIYAILLTLFTTFMVGFSIFAPANFYAAYGIEGDPAFQYSWSFRYLVILAVMVFGLIQRNIQGIFITVLARFLVDLFDTIGIILFNTPPASTGSFLMQIFVLIGPQLLCLYLLIRTDRQVVATSA